MINNKKVCCKKSGNAKVKSIYIVSNCLNKDGSFDKRKVKIDKHCLISSFSKSVIIEEIEINKSDETRY